MDASSKSLGNRLSYGGRSGYADRFRSARSAFIAGWRVRLRTGVIVAGQVALFFGIAVVCDAVVSYVRLPIPGNALGIAVVFAMLRFGLLRLVWLEMGAALLVRHLSLFFVPIAVATIATLPSLLPIVLPLAIALVASTALGIGAAGLAAERVAEAGSSLQAKRRVLA